MKCSVYIATSADGYIATPDGGVDWLHSAGNSEADMGGHADMGFVAFMASVDCMVMGRKCMEMISNMNLPPEQWPLICKNCSGQILLSGPPVCRPEFLPRCAPAEPCWDR